MAQIVFTSDTTKAEALAGINANFTEVYGSLVSQADDIATINGVLAGLGTMSGQNSGGIAVTGGTMSGVTITVIPASPIFPVDPTTQTPAGVFMVTVGATEKFIPFYA